MRKRQTKNSRSSLFLPANEQIRSRQVLLIDEEAGTRGVMATEQALVVARERQLDLVVVGPHAAPPVAKILDLGKYRYEKEREARQQRRNQTVVDIKEVRLSPQMEEHDLNQRLKRAGGFLKEGHRLKLSLRFRGRQIVFKEKGLELLTRFADQLGQEFESEPRFAGKIVNVLLKTKKHETEDE